ncbi:MAG TPA: hypothetical protein VLV32_07255 [Burkholderiales bacterium]|nr:hypothetical protein [Burkholderiales bacterium]
MKYNRFNCSIEADSGLCPTSGSEANEFDMDLTNEAEPDRHAALCDDDSQLTGLDESIAEIWLDIPGWAKYFKELNEMQ